MPLTAPPALEGLKQAETKRWATCWRIERTDGRVFRFTSADHVVEVPRDTEQWVLETYTPVGGFEGSARRRENAMRDHDLDFRGVITDDAITNADLRSGKFHESKIEEMIIDSTYPWAGVIQSSTYWCDFCEFDGEVWTAEVSGPTRKLRHKVGGIFTRTCGARLGDARCKVDMAAHTFAGIRVLGMLDGERRMAIRADPATLADTFDDEWFADGTVTFTSGLNEGESADIKLYVSATRDIQLQLPMPFDVMAGDEFTMTTGCDTNRSTCVQKFDNVLNFRGFPTIPGTDRVLRVRPA